MEDQSSISDNTVINNTAPEIDTDEPYVINLNNLCGADNPPFFNQSQSWDTLRPDVSSCFRKTILIWIPCAYFWLLLPIRLKQIMNKNGRLGHQVNGDVSTLNICKVVVACFLIIIGIIDLAFAITENDGITVADILDPSMRIITFCAVIALLQGERLNGCITSWLQFFFWLLYLIGGAVAMYSNILGFMQETVSTGPFITFILTMTGALLSFILHFWAEPSRMYVTPDSGLADFDDEKDRMCPKLSASFPSELAFSWFTSFAWTGFKRALTKEDLWNLPPELTSRRIVPRFKRYWDPAVQSALKYNSSLPPSNTNAVGNEGNGEVSFNASSKAIQVNTPPRGKKKNDSASSNTKPKVARIFPTLVKAFGARFVAGSVLKMIHDILIFISPYILKRIIKFAKGEEEMWKGIVYACLILITAIIQSIALSRYFYDMYAVGIRIRSSVISSIYRKSLRVSPSGKKEATTGEVVNLMSVDVQRIVDLMPYFNMLWSAPLQIILCVVFLWQIVGPSVLAGLLVMVLLVPVNGFIAMKAKALQVKQMKEKDNRVKMMNEILQGIKILKLYAWEPSFQTAATKIRDKEIKILREMGYLAAGTSFVWACAPFLVSLVTFATYVLSDPNNILDAERAFVALSLFNILRFPLSMLPMMISGMVQASVSVKRIDKYMNSSELNEDAVTKLNTSSQNDMNKQSGVLKETNITIQQNSAVEMTHASFGWSTDDKKICLENISLAIPKKSLVAVVGQVGSGKSSLLSAILGEMEPMLLEGNLNIDTDVSKIDNGSIIVDGTIAYAAQQAWIQNATLKNNILFSKKMDENRYNRVVEACALEADLEILSAGDETEIGEKGINLSGGQKQRVSLARATYSDADIFLLDDPLSAVDSHVGKHIFEKVIGSDGLLSGKTRVLVTHGLTYLPCTDKIIVMKDGKISETGTYKELLSKKGDFADFLIQHFSQAQNAEAEGLDEELADEIRKDLEITIGRETLESQIKERKTSESHEISNSAGSLSSLSSPLKNSSGNLSGSKSRDTSPKKRMSIRSSNQEPKDQTTRQDSVISSEGKQQNVDQNAKLNAKKEAKAANTQYEAEKTETGKVSIYVYLYYLKSMGIHLASACVFFFTINQVFSAASSVWLSRWSDAMSQDKSNLTSDEITSQRDLYLGVYGGLGLGQAVAVIFASLFLYIATLTGANKLHHIMLGNVLRSPMSFFDTTPQGRILNRFGKDVDVLDSTMPMIIRGWITCLLGVFSTFLIITYTTPTFILPIAIVLTGYYLVQKVYVATSRQLKRLESVSRSPIYSQFGETINGASTIRAYGLEKQFILNSENMVDENQMANFPSVVSNRWLAVRLETVGNLIIFCASLLAVLGRGNLTPGLVGLSVSYALSVTQTLNWLVRMTSEVETNIVAVERLKEYSESKTEADWSIIETKPQSNWPSKGTICVDGYSTRYRDNLDLVLRKVSFQVDGGKKVGIVGRTGAGKSSFTLALFRIIEAAEGSISVDGIDIATLGLHDLRSHITIIPQDPVLFSGSLRMNLDPFSLYTDEKVWQALKLAHLESFVSSLTEGLEYSIAEGGENLSVGQRQLVCLARAVLRKTKILVLDEATAAVDMETDELIQATIRKEFSDCTILTIAHRLSTIMDYDMILVLQNGEKAEYDSPERLKENTSSIFYSMCKDAGLVN